MSSLRRQIAPWLARLGLWALALGLALAAGASSLVLETPYAPLAVTTAVAALVAGAVLLFRPAWSLYLMVFATLLPPGLIPFDLQSHVRNLTLLLALGAWLVQVLFDGRRAAMPAPAILMVAVILAHVVSLTWSPALELARSELVQWTIVLLVLVLILNVVDRAAILAGLMRVLALNGWVLILAGLFTMASGEYTLGERLKVLEMNENSYGVALLLTLTGVMWIAMQPGRAQRLLVLLSLVYIPLAAMLAVFTGSRGSLLSLAVVLGLFLVLRPTRVWGWYSVLLGLVAVVAMPGLFVSVTNRLQNPEEDLSGDRAVLWEASAALIADHPWGVGAGYGPFALHPYILRRTPNYANRPDLPSHNPILEIGIDTGILGMVIYCAMIAVALWGFAQSWRQHQAGDPAWNAYFSLVAVVTLGYSLSWIKAGGVYYSESFIIQLALLALPAYGAIARVPRIEQPQETSQ